MVKPFKITFSETSRPMIFELGVQHQGLGPYKVCSNDDPGLTLVYFTARSAILPNSFVWENALLNYWSLMEVSTNVAPRIVHPTLIVHVNNKPCSFCQVDDKRRSCRLEYSINCYTNVKFLESITMVTFWSEFNILWTKVTSNAFPELDSGSHWDSDIYVIKSGPVFRHAPGHDKIPSSWFSDLTPYLSCSDMMRQ